MLLRKSKKSNILIRKSLPIFPSLSTLNSEKVTFSLLEFKKDTKLDLNQPLGRRPLNKSPRRYVMSRASKVMVISCSFQNVLIHILDPLQFWKILVPSVKKLHRESSHKPESKVILRSLGNKEILEKNQHWME